MAKRRPPRPKSLKGLKGGLRAYWKKKGVPEREPATAGKRKTARKNSR